MSRLRASVALLAASCAFAALSAHATVASASASGVLYTQAGVKAAKRYARTRAGVVSFAVLDPRGRVSGVGLNVQHRSASVSKAMLMVAVLRRAHDRALTSTEKALLRPMITLSDNEAARQVYAMAGGDTALVHVAHLAHMTHFTPAGYWSEARLTALDQARLFLRMSKLLPERHRAYGLGLLKSIVSYERWGIAPVAKRHKMRIFFKGGWRNGITHQVALLRRGHRRIALAVMTTGEPSIPYGEETIERIAGLVLG